MMEQVMLRAGEIARRRLAGERWSEIAAALSVPEAKLKVYWGRVARGRSPEVMAAEARVAEAEGRAADALAEAGAAEERGKALSAVALAAAEDRAARAEAIEIDLRRQLVLATQSVERYRRLIDTAQAEAQAASALEADLRAEITRLSVDMLKAKQGNSSTFLRTLHRDFAAAKDELDLTRQWLLAIVAAYRAADVNALNAAIPPVLAWADRQG